ncbi:MAG TPA: DUF3667 domain-containing protein [Aliidongia sp.]|uniref:DUF3667 domain-containing protein n=1 Tax=Aliidongia sp. TaxID=1914230 RepID=UPI002DDD90A0|nr:DUF3667 domain-containing protein [Aliidongia sp.]HEV2674582.1 DUF3667 domain-containing protein [Aliidongia sp.]
MHLEKLSPHESAAALAATEVGKAHLCPNCATEVTTRFCGNCGQSRHDHSRSLFEVARELLEHHLFLDGKMMTTVVALLFRPGRLTRAFIEGRRVRFVSPIRLYLFSSFAFFVALWASGFAMIQFHVPHDLVAALSRDGSAGQVVETDRSQGADTPIIEILRPARDGEALPDAVKSRFTLDDDIQSAAKDSAGARKLVDFTGRLTDGFSLALAHPRALNPVIDEWLPRLLIVTLPFTALLLALFGRKRRLYFVDHVTFALHLQAFVFAVGLVVIGVRLAWPTVALGWPLFAIFSVYSYLAYLRTYPGNRLWAGIKLGIIGSIYCLSLLLGIIALLVYGVSTLPGA